MTVAAFTVGVVSLVIAVSSLSWQVYTFLLEGARPKLTPVVGILTRGGGLVTSDAFKDVRSSLTLAVEQIGPGMPIVGVKVVNAGRAPFHVAGWAIRAVPSGTSFTVLDDPVGSPTVPCDIPAGAEQTFFMEFGAAARLKFAADATEKKPQRIVITVFSGGRTLTSKPIASENLTIR